MQATSLPKVLQTQKVKSLDGDLKGIAEELLKDKFGIEETIPDKGDMFPGDAQYATRCDVHQSGLYTGPRPRCSWPECFTRSGMEHYPRPGFVASTSMCSLDAIYELMREFDRRGIHRSRRVFSMDPLYFDELVREASGRSYVEVNPVTRAPILFGIPVKLSRSSRSAELREVFNF